MNLKFIFLHKRLNLVLLIIQKRQKIFKKDGFNKKKGYENF